MTGLPTDGLPPVALVGPTATGKSELALAIARARPEVEIVSVDSMQVYRGMDIGTAKPTAAEQAEVPHHLIDLVDPDEDYTVSRYQADCRAAVAAIQERDRRPLLVGGTGLYFRAAVDDLEFPGRYPEARAEVEAEPDTVGLHARLNDLDPVAARRMEPTNRRRIVRALEVCIGSGRAFSSYGPGLETYPSLGFPVWGMSVPREAIDARIAERYQAQMDAGFLTEVEQLAARAGGLSATARQALGYRELLSHVEDGVPLDAALDDAVTRTRRFARRQERWFRRDPRVSWCEHAGNPMALLDQVLGDWPLDTRQGQRR